MSKIDKEDKDTLVERIQTAVYIIGTWGEVDGAHHKMWVLDQVLRVLLGGEDSGGYVPDYTASPEYISTIQEWECPEGYHEWDWDKGIVP